LASFLKNCFGYNDLRGLKVCVLLDSFFLQLSSAFCNKVLNPDYDSTLWDDNIKLNFDPTTMLCWYQDIDNGVIYLNAYSDSSTWMFRGDLSNFPQIQFMLTAITLRDYGQNEYKESLLDFLTRAAISILSVLSDENQQRVIKYISLFTEHDDSYLTQYLDMTTNRNENVNQYVIRQWIALKRVKDNFFDPYVDDEETIILETHTNIILETIKDIITNMKKTTFTEEQLEQLLKVQTVRSFFIEESNKIGFATLDKMVLYCLTISA
jgi:hypothetical protein